MLTLRYGTPGDFGIADLPGGIDGLAGIEAAAPEDGLRLRPYGEDTGADLTSWSLVFDLYRPAGQGVWTALVQTDPENADDGEVFLRESGPGSAGLGIGGVYEGDFAYDAWQRVALVVETDAAGGTTLAKYIDGALVGEQEVDPARYVIDGAAGALLLADENGETADVGLNGLAFAPRALAAGEVAALGAADADGIIDAPDGATEFGFDEASLDASFGPAALDVFEKAPPPPDKVRPANPVADAIVAPDSEDRVIDLTTVFGAGFTFAAATSDAGVADVALDGDALTLDLGAHGVADIRVTGTDAAGAAIEDAFRVRVAGPDAYTIAVLPDTQDYTSNPFLAQSFFDMTSWLADNEENLRIEHVIHVGDITDDNLASQWAVAEPAMRQLDGKITYSLLPGNHDQALGGTANDHSTAFLDALFAPGTQAAVNPSFGGTYDREPERAANTFHTFEARDGTDWLVLSLEFGPRDDVIRWASDVIEGHLDHRVILNTHSFVNWAGRHEPLGIPLYDEGPGYHYGMRFDPEGANDGEELYRALASRYPNVALGFGGHIFGDGAETDVSWSQHGTPFHQFLVNYQDGVAAEITGNGDPEKGDEGGNGAMRLIHIDPSNDTLSTSTYFTDFDEYLTGARGGPEPSRDGLTGPYREHEETFEGVDLGTPELRAQAEAGGTLVASGLKVTLDGARTLDPNGDIIGARWIDARGLEVAEGLSPTIAARRGVADYTLQVIDAAGRVTSDDQRVIGAKGALLVETFDDGSRDGWSDNPNFIVKGSAFARGVPAPGEPAASAAVYDFSDEPDQFLEWTDPAAADWSGVMVDLVLRAFDNDASGVAFHWRDAANHYRFFFNGETNERSLVRVEDGVETVLATVPEGYRFNDEIALRVASGPDGIRVFMDGEDVFGGPVVDPDPLPGGSIALYSNEQRHVRFDDVVVTPLARTAHAALPERVVDFDGDGVATVAASAAGSFAAGEIGRYVWTDAEGARLARGAEAELELPVGANVVNLTVTARGGVDSAARPVEVVSADRVLLHETFDDPAALDAWSIVDEGEFGGVGPDGLASDWTVEDGALVQASDLQSRQLQWTGASAEDPWQRGWSPLGDGVNVLRRGTTALYDDPDAKDWSDYSVEATVATPDDQAFGFVFHYEDAENYYKLELDARGTLDYSPGGLDEGSLFQLLKVEDGYESILTQVPRRYASDTEMRVRLDVEGDEIQAWLDGEPLFAYAIEDRAHPSGTFGLYSWGSEGVRFDDVAVLDLGAPDPTRSMSEADTFALL